MGSVVKKQTKKNKIEGESAEKIVSSTAGADAENSKSHFLTLKVVVTIVAFALRFWRIDHPDEVVFDEVHFGKFASYYLQRQYYFDLHPPLAKLMFAGVGWLIGYDGHFKFDNIGDNYILNKVPYLSYRSLSAFMGSATVPLVFGVLEHGGFSPISCTFGALLVALDTAQIAQTRLILLDAALSFFMICAVYSYVRFRKCRHTPFSVAWWSWLLLTGISLSSVISTKYVGLFSFLMIGSAVIIDIWQILDVRGKKVEEQHTIGYVLKHFVARFWALIIIPFILYLFWFYVHFAVLKNSGTGDSFMSPEFQSTLHANPLTKEALDVYFFDNVRLQSITSQVYLHSHLHRYPLQYPDGRISSQGQQVNGYPEEDPNNLWQILPPTEFKDDSLKGQPVAGNQHVMLRHVATDTYLMTHDVASPGFNTNEEFTTCPAEEAYSEKHDFTLFNLDVVSGGDLLRTKLTQFRLKHVKTNVVMWMANNILPEWGFGQIEINGNKKLDASGSIWTISAIEGFESDDRKASRRTIGNGEVAPRRSFWKDYVELQQAMFIHNNQLTNTHPYMSSPHSWPLLLNGISFWSSNSSKAQIFLVGNFVGWYLELIAVILFVCLYVFDNLAILRDFNWLEPYARYKLHTTMLWFFIGWATHYFPFFLMGRQLFLHHYLPAQILGALVTASVLDFMTGQLKSPKAHLQRTKLSSYTCGVLIFALVVCFIYFAPLVYGIPLEPSGVRGRQWNNIELHHNRDLE